MSAFLAWLSGRYPVVPARWARPVVAVACVAAMAAAFLAAGLTYHRVGAVAGRWLAGGACIVVLLGTFFGVLYLTQAVAGRMLRVDEGAQHRPGHRP